MPTKFDPTSPYARGVLADHIIQVVRNAGFTEASVLPQGIKERVFYREVDGLPGVRVVVYTTVEGVDLQATVRECGEDAIRVCVVYRDSERKDHGLVSMTRVHRTGTVEAIRERLLIRMREAWRAAFQVPRCTHCGAPTFLSKKKNRVCAALCWTKRGGGVP